MAKLNWKQHALTRLKISGFILALVGWLMIVTVILEKAYGQDLSALEDFIKTDTVKWGIKILVIILLIVLIKGQAGINHLLERYKALRITFKTVLVGGVIGWALGLGSLLIR